MPRKQTSSGARLIAGDGGERRSGQLSGLPDPLEDLPYAVELWTLDRAAVERVLARAGNASLAQAIFAAAQNEHVGRRITLRHGDEVVATRN